MKRKSDFIVEIIVNGQHYDITQFVISYKFQGGPEQPIRYFEMEVSKKTIDNEYPRLIDGLIDDDGVVVGSTYIYVDAVGHGTFTVTKLWLEDYIYEFTALGVENTLNTSVTAVVRNATQENYLTHWQKFSSGGQTVSVVAFAEYLTDLIGIENNGYISGYDESDPPQPIYKQIEVGDVVEVEVPNPSIGGLYRFTGNSNSALNPASTAYKLFNGWKSTLNVDDTFDMWFSSSFSDGSNHSQPSEENRNPIMFKDGLPVMVALNLCALMDDAFIFFANGEVNGSMVNRLYYVRYGDDLPLASNPGMPNQNGVINVYPDMKSEYETYTQFDYLMAKKMAGLSSKNGEGSETITNVQKVTCSALDGVGSVSYTEIGEYSIAKYGEKASSTIISEYICTDYPENIAKNTVKRYQDPTRSIVFNMIESTTTSEGTVAWEETIPVYSYAYAINDNVNDIHLVNTHKCQPDMIEGEANPNKVDNALLRMSTYIRSYPDMVTEYTFGVMKDTTIAQEITSSLTGSMGARIGEEDVGTPAMPIYLDGGVPKPATSLVSSLLPAVYPVGSIYISVNPTNPQTLFGFGTWEAFGAGRTLVGYDSTDTDFDTAEETGGEKTHTLTTSEMPSHSHGISSDAEGQVYFGPMVLEGSSTGVSGTVTRSGVFDGPHTGWVNGDGDVASSGNANKSMYMQIHQYSHSHGGSTGNSGDGNSHNNLQPYIVTYMWKRIA